MDRVGCGIEDISVRTPDFCYDKIALKVRHDRKPVLTACHGCNQLSVRGTEFKHRASQRFAVRVGFEDRKTFQFLIAENDRYCFAGFDSGFLRRFRNLITCGRRDLRNFHCGSGLEIRDYDRPVRPCHKVLAYQRTVNRFHAEPRSRKRGRILRIHLLNQQIAVRFIFKMKDSGFPSLNKNCFRYGVKRISVRNRDFTHGHIPRFHLRYCGISCAGGGHLGDELSIGFFHSERYSTDRISVLFICFQNI